MISNPSYNRRIIQPKRLRKVLKQAKKTFNITDMQSNTRRSEVNIHLIKIALRFYTLKKQNETTEMIQYLQQNLKTKGLLVRNQEEDRKRDLTYRYKWKNHSKVWSPNRKDHGWTTGVEWYCWVIKNVKQRWLCCMCNCHSVPGGCSWTWDTVSLTLVNQLFLG